MSSLPPSKPEKTSVGRIEHLHSLIDILFIQKLSMASQATINPSLSLTEESKEQTLSQKIGGVFIAIAVLALIAAFAGAGKEHPSLFLGIIISMFFFGSYLLRSTLFPRTGRNS